MRFLVLALMGTFILLQSSPIFSGEARQTNKPKPSVSGIPQPDPIPQPSGTSTPTKIPESHKSNPKP